jgi:SAM-dependent methyltransferase
MKKIIGNPQKKNIENIEIINKVKINNYYIKNFEDFRVKIINSIDPDDEVLDVGKSSREFYDKIKSKSLETLDVNDFGDYPDIIFDLCDTCDPSLVNKYDKIICLAILEHVYNPFKSVENLKAMLKPNGIIFGYAPYIYSYHAPNNLVFQDYFRFSRDALAYLFKDFSYVEIYPVRGRISSPLYNLFGSKWKKYIEKFKINIFLDKFVNDKTNSLQCSGYNFILKK